MNIYFRYVPASIPAINDFNYLSSTIKSSIADSLRIAEPMQVTVSKCPGACDDAGSDVCVIIVCKSSFADLNSIEQIRQSVLSAIQKDQDSIRLYRINIKVDPNYVPPKAVLEQQTFQLFNKLVEKIDNSKSDSDSEIDYEKRALSYQAVEPEYTFDRVILPSEVREKIDEALNIFKYNSKVFDEWGLRAIEPHPSSSLSFYGPSGTGKTMAAEAIASYLGKKILRVSYADIESKYHGEGPKMVKAIFCAAERDDAVLFIDESDSLLSKRLTNVSSGSEQAINSMRSQLLISLERFEGIVIFATNLVVNYDQAFLTRLISVEFKLPDIESRKKIWNVHTKESNGNKLNIPLASDVNFDELAEKYEFCGREIKKAVISACIRAAMGEREQVSQDDFISACDKVVEEEKALASAKDHTTSIKISDEQQSDKDLASIVKKAFAKDKTGSDDNIITESASDESGAISAEVN